MMTKIVIINGGPQRGKDTFVNFIKHNYLIGTVVNVSTIDCVKRAATALGWDGVKDEKGRKFLSELKYFANQYYPISVNTVREAVECYPRAACIFVHCREPKEIDKIKEEFDAITILVTNEDDYVEGPASVSDNYSDLHVLDYDYDYVIPNNGTLQDLEKAAKKFITEVLL